MIQWRNAAAPVLSISLKLTPSRLLESLSSPPPRTHVDASAVARLAIESDLKLVCLMAAANALSGVYQDWVINKY